MQMFFTFIPITRKCAELILSFYVDLQSIILILFCHAFKIALPTPYKILYHNLLKNVTSISGEGNVYL